MKKSIKLFSMMILAAGMMMVQPVMAQTGKTERMEQKEIEKKEEDLRKVIDRKPMRISRTKEKEWTKEGFKTFGLPLANQFDRSFLKEYEKTSDGSLRYITFQAEAVGNTYIAAQSMLENVAKVRIANKISSSVGALVDIEIHNNPTSATTCQSITKSLENAKVLVAQKLGGVITTVEAYKVLPNGNYVLRIRAHYDIQNAASIIRNVLLEELKKEGEINKEQLESILGIDRITKQIEKDAYDEIAD